MAHYLFRFTLKILHLPVAYLPWIIGGREVYSHSLCLGLQSVGIDCLVAFHQHTHVGEPLGRHEHEGVSVIVLPPLPNFYDRRSSCSKVYDFLPGFEELLDKEKPDLVHFHDQGGGASLSHFRAVKQRKIKAVITYHSPGQTCPQGELMRYGHTPCDGQVRLHRCTACRLTVTGLPKPLAHLAALTEWPGVNPWSLSQWLRVLSRRQMTRLFRDSLMEFTSLADAIVVLADWCRGVWLANGTPEKKLHLIRTAGRSPWLGNPGSKYPERKILKLACLGRCTPVKGFHVLVEAIKLLPENAPVQVHFYGPYWNSSVYGENLQKQIEGDSRFMPPQLIPNAEMLPVLAEMDMVVIPSLWLETGPLTFFDAIAARVPVLGSRLGGLEELVCEGKNGILFDAGNIGQLKTCIEEVLADGDILLRMRETIIPLRTMADVTKDYVRLYEKLIVREKPCIGQEAELGHIL